MRDMQLRTHPKMKWEGFSNWPPVSRIRTPCEYSWTRSIWPVKIPIAFNLDDRVVFVSFDDVRPPVTLCVDGNLVSVLADSGYPGKKRDSVDQEDTTLVHETAKLNDPIRRGESMAQSRIG
jgi:hypothetical protein